MNKRHEQFKQTMIALGAKCLNECPGPETAPNTSRLEFWGVPGKGVCVAQLWNDGGVTTFVDWPTGHTWEDLQNILTTTTAAENQANELESRRIDSAQLERMVHKLDEAMPHFKSMMGSPSDHAEMALVRLIEDRDTMRGALTKLTSPYESMTFRERCNAWDEARAALALAEGKEAV